MDKSLVVLVMGVSGSGKTTVGSLLAKRLNFKFVDGDDFHSDANRAKMHAGQALSDEDRRPWLETIAEHIRTWLAAGQNVVLACSALKESYRKILIGSAQARVPIVLLDGSFELLNDRLSRRNHPFMNQSLLQSQFDTLEKPADAITLNAAEGVAANVEIAVQKLSGWLVAESGVHS